MTNKRFPQDWAAAELLKQYIRNHRRYAAKKSRLTTQTGDDGPEDENLRNIEDEDDDGGNIN